MAYISFKGIHFSKKYQNFLKKFIHNEDVIEFLFKNSRLETFEKSIAIDGQLFYIDYVLGESEDSSRDIIKTYEEYEGRIPLNYLAIAVFDEINFICIDSNNHFYIWSRDKNDLYFSKKENVYKTQDTRLKLIAKSFIDFESLLIDDVDTKLYGDDEYDEFSDPNIPFEDSDIDDDFKNPELFFKQSSEEIDIQLKKLALSTKGIELLELFKQKKLL